MADEARDTLRVLGIAGSLRKGSYNRALLRTAVELAPDGMTIEVYDRLREIPPYDQDQDAAGQPEVVLDLKRRIREADALLIATPEYNYGIPGVLKNAIDWASRPPKDTPLAEKPAAIMGASVGIGGTIRAQLALRQAFLFTNTHPVQKPEVIVAEAAQKFDAELRLVDPAAREFLRQLLESLATWTRRLRGGA
ncbi:MAG TPA: NADPH-dependent FMN reductase [Longimicrobiales bacterium]|nr:NADPH-dependent FMN reductase [Longimicrobiales bacterium]